MPLLGPGSAKPHCVLHRVRDTCLLVGLVPRTRRSAASAVRC